MCRRARGLFGESSEEGGEPLQATAAERCAFAERFDFFELALSLAEIVQQDLDKFCLQLQLLTIRYPNKSIDHS